MSQHLPQEWLEELKNKNDIVEVVSQYVSLRQNGRKFWGLCPFHNEKTPSFSVDMDKQFYYCFGCQAGGSVLKFVESIEHLEFFEAAEFLADRINLPMPQQENIKYIKKQDDKQVYELLREAAKTFVKNLDAEGASKAREYLQKRGIDKETVKKFGIGFALDDWQAMMNAMKAKGYSESLLLKAGLAVSKNNKTYDMFRNRVIFPIVDTRKRVIGFGGRVMDDSLPKYINSADSGIFNKRKNLFGLNSIAKDVNRGHAVLVEGYMDVISLSKNGVKNAVATLGTAITPEQGRLLKRYFDKVYISYDGDIAGIKATERAIDILNAQKLITKVICIPEGDDPDGYIIKNGLDAYGQLMDNALDPLVFRMQVLSGKYKLSIAAERAEYARAALELIKSAKDALEAESCLKKLKVQTGFSEEALKEQYNRLQTKTSAVNMFTDKRNNIHVKTTKKQDEYEFLEMKLLSLAASGHMEKVTENGSDDMIKHPVYKRVYSMLHEGFTAPDILDSFEDKDETGLAAIALSTEVLTDDSEKYIQDCIKRMRQLEIERKINALKMLLRDEGITKEKRSEIAAKLQELNASFQKIKSL